MARKKASKFVAPKDISDLKSQYADFLVGADRLQATSDDILSTGSIKVDALLHGGLYRGTISEFFGPPGGGKSTLAIRTAGVCLEQGGRVAYIDLEHGLGGGIQISTGDENIHVDGWLQKNGVDPNHPNFDVWRPTFAEDVFNLLLNIIMGNLYDLVIIDSYAALVTRSEMEDEVGASHYGKVAKISSEGLKKVFKAYELGEGRSHVIVINQIRDNIGGYGYKSTGGNALPHYCATRLQVFRIGGSENSGEAVTKSRVINRKNRFSPPGETEIAISSTFGLDVMDELLQWCLQDDVGYVKQAGAWYTVFPLEEDGEEVKMQGAYSVKRHLQENGYYEALRDRISSSLLTAV